MVRRKIQRLEVVVVSLDLRAFADRIAHCLEDRDDLILHAQHWMLGTDGPHHARKRDVDALRGESLFIVNFPSLFRTASEPSELFFHCAEISDPSRPLPNNFLELVAEKIDSETHHLFVLGGGRLQPSLVYVVQDS